MNTNQILTLTVVFGASACSGLAAGITLETAPPVVVNTSPTAGATGVDPALTELRVTYSKPMQDGSWSWSTWGEENFPEMTGQPRYLRDGRTCVLPVKLEPNRFYATWLNSETFKNFQDRDGRPAVPYLLSFRTGPAGARTPSQAQLGPVTEVLLPAPDGPVAELLDLDTGRRAAHQSFGRNDRETHAWIREQQLDVLGVLEKGHVAVLCMDMAVMPWASNRWDDVSAADILTNRLLGQMEPHTITGISPETDNTTTWIFRTREEGHGVLSIVGPSENPPGVTVRYRMVEGLTAGTGPDADASRLNADQRAVIAWTDRQFRSYFDNRTFEGWSDEERAQLEVKCIDALSGPRSRDYYTAINTLGALKSTNALPRLRELAFERVDKNNRDRWMAVRILGQLGDRQSVPDLIHLVYHGNQNTHWWAQIALVQLTGQNFGGDWEAWGRWWNASGGQPPYDPQIIRWWDGQADTVEGLKDTLAEGDRKFLQSL